jgi:hypothetical protein
VLDFYDLMTVLERIQEINAQIQHFQDMIYIDEHEIERRPKMYPTVLGYFRCPLCCCHLCGGDKVDAIEQYCREKYELRREYEILTHSSKARNSTGVAFVTFKTIAACTEFKEKFAKGLFWNKKYLDTLFSAPRQLTSSMAPAATTTSIDRTKSNSVPLQAMSSINDDSQTIDATIVNIDDTATSVSKPNSNSSYNSNSNFNSDSDSDSDLDLEYEGAAAAAAPAAVAPATLERTESIPLVSNIFDSKKRLFNQQNQPYQDDTDADADAQVRQQQRERVKVLATKLMVCLAKHTNELERQRERERETD